jgi:hypothetical protein
VDELRWAGLRGHLVAAGAVVLRVGPGDAPIDPDAAAELASLPVIVVVEVPERPDDVEPSWRAAADVVLAEGDDSLGDLLATVERHPLASVAYALLLRDAERREVAAGLIAESAT